MVSKELRIVASHPVQYHVPYYRSLVEAGLDVEVGYYHGGMAGQTRYDDGFGLEYAWDIDLLSGYRKKVFLDRFAGYSLREQIRLSARLLPWMLRRRKAPILLIGWFSEIIWLAWFLRILFRMPTLQFCETTEMSFHAAPKPRWRVALLGWLLRHSSAVLYIGSRNRDFLLGMGVPAQRLFPALYSVANEFFASSAGELMKSRRELCSQHGLDPDLPVFLFCGKLIPKKKPIELLQAYCEAGLIHQAQLLFVGDGMLRQAIEDRARAAHARNIRVLGFLNYTEMPLAYVLGELLCLLSDPTETWGLVVNEALSCGRPVIVADSVGCAPDLVNDRNGWRVPLDDQRALIRVLREAFQRHNEWSAMGRAGQRRVSRHSFSAMAAGTQSALASLNGDV